MNPAILCELLRQCQHFFGIFNLITDYPDRLRGFKRDEDCSVRLGGAALECDACRRRFSRIRTASPCEDTSALQSSWREPQLPPNFSGRMIVGNGSGRPPIVPVINGIYAAHRFLASLFFDYVRDKSGCAGDHEDPVERRGIHS